MIGRSAESFSRSAWVAEKLHVEAGLGEQPLLDADDDRQVEHLVVRRDPDDGPCGHGRLLLDCGPQFIMGAARAAIANPEWHPAVIGRESGR